MEAKQAAYGGGIGGPPGRSTRPMRPAPYERPDRHGGGGYGGGMRGSGYDSYSAPKDRFGGGGGASGPGGRFRGMSYYSVYQLNILTSLHEFHTGLAGAFYVQVSFAAQ